MAADPGVTIVDLLPLLLVLLLLVPAIAGPRALSHGFGLVLRIAILAALFAGLATAAGNGGRAAFPEPPEPAPAPQSYQGPAPPAAPSDAMI